MVVLVMFSADTKQTKMQKKLQLLCMKVEKVVNKAALLHIFSRGARFIFLVAAKNTICISCMLSL